MAHSQYDVLINIETTQAVPAIQRVGVEMERLDRRVERSYDRLNRFKNVFVSMASSYVIYSVIQGFSRISDVLGEFEGQMARLQAITGVSTSQLKTFADVTRYYGRETEHTAVDVADAMQQLGQAGYAMNDIIRITPQVLDLATSSAVSMGEAVGYLSSILKQYALDATDSQHVTDVLAKTSMATLSNIKDLALGFSYAGAIAHTYGVSVEETSAALGVLADHGLQADKAGTALRSIFIELGEAGPKVQKVLDELGLTMDDVNFQTKGLYGVLQTLQKFEPEQITKIFGKRGGPGALTLREFAESVRALTEENEKANGVNRIMADIIRDSLPSAIKVFQSAITELKLRIGDAGLTGALRSMVEVGTETVKILGGFEDPLKKSSTAANILADSIRGLGMAIEVLAGATAIQALIKLSGVLATTAGSLSRIIKLMGLYGVAKTAKHIGGVSGTLFGTGGLASTAMAAPFTTGLAVAGAGYAAYQTGSYINDTFINKTDKAAESLNSFQGVVGETNKAITDFVGAFESLAGKPDRVETEQEALNRTIGELSRLLPRATNDLNRYTAGMQNAEVTIVNLKKAQQDLYVEQQKKVLQDKRDMRLMMLEQEKSSYFGPFPFGLLNKIDTLSSSNRQSGRDRYSNYLQTVAERQKIIEDEFNKAMADLMRGPVTETAQAESPTPYPYGPRLSDEVSEWYDESIERYKEYQEKYRLIGMQGREREIEEARIQADKKRKAEEEEYSKIQESIRKLGSKATAEDKALAKATYDDRLRDIEQTYLKEKSEINKQYDDEERRRALELSRDMEDYSRDRAYAISAASAEGRRRDILQAEKDYADTITSNKRALDDILNDNTASDAIKAQAQANYNSKSIQAANAHRAELAAISKEWNQKELEELQRYNEAVSGYYRDSADVRKQIELEARLAILPERERKESYLVAGADADVEAYRRRAEEQEKVLRELIKDEAQYQAEKLKLDADTQDNIITRYEQLFVDMGVLRDEFLKEDKEKWQKEQDELNAIFERLSKRYDPLYKMAANMEDVDRLRASGRNVSDTVVRNMELEAEREAKKRLRDYVIEFGDWRQGMALAFYDLGQEAEFTAAQVHDAFSEAFAGVKNTFMDFIEDGEASFSDFANSIRMSLTSILYDKTIGSVFSALGNSLFGGGSLASIIGMKGARAGGGPVSPGTWLVGESGPELLTLGSSGYVHNNNSLTNLMNSGNQTIITNNYYQNTGGGYTLKGSTKQTLKRSDNQQKRDVRQSLF